MSLQPGKGEVPCGVWRVQGKRNVLYLAATQHTITKDQIPFPSPLYAAYMNSEELSVEADLGNPRTKNLLKGKCSRWMRSHRADFECPSGRCLGDYLTDETVQRLRKQYDYPKVERLTPLGLIYWIKFFGAKKVADSVVGDLEGVEDHFLAQARRDQKPIRELDDVPGNLNSLFGGMEDEVETTKAQIAKLGPDAVLEDTLRANCKKAIHSDIKWGLRRTKPELRQIWRHGDLNKGERHLNELNQYEPELYEWMLVRRNHQWLPKIQKSLNSTHNQMVLVGGLHMPGKDGLVNLLRHEGYSVDQMYGIDCPVVNASVDPPPPRRLARHSFRR